MADPGGGCRGFAPPLRDKNIHFFHNLRVFFYRLVGCTPLRVPKNNHFSQLKGFLSGLVGCTDLFFACPIFEWWGASPLHQILDPPPVGVTFVAITLLPWCRKLILKWKGGGGGRKTQSYTAYMPTLWMWLTIQYFFTSVFFYDICDPRSCTATHTLINWKCTDRDVSHALARVHDSILSLGLE